MTQLNLSQPLWFKIDHKNVPVQRCIKDYIKTVDTFEEWPGCPMHESDILHLILDLIVNYGVYSDSLNLAILCHELCTATVHGHPTLLRTDLFGTHD